APLAISPRSTERVSAGRASQGGTIPADAEVARAGSEKGAPRSRRCPAVDDRESAGGMAQRSMVRLLHTADVHLGARYRDLGPSAAEQRGRQMAAFKASVDLALAEKIDLFLISCDLFDSNTQPRRSVEAVAAELRRL